LHKLSTAIFYVNGKEGGLILCFFSRTQHLLQDKYLSTVDLLILIKSFIFYKKSHLLQKSKNLKIIKL